MIFVTVGTQLPFDRLIEIMDEIIGEDGGRAVVQAGNSTCKPRSFKLTPDFSRKEFQKIFHESEVVVSHAGMGTILTAIKFKKPLIIFPRLSEYGEHRNDHQLATANYMKDLPNIFVARDKDELIQCILKAKSLESIEEIETLNRAPFIEKLKTYIENV